MTSRRVWWAALLVLGVGALPAAAQTRLEWKFREGDKFYVESMTTQRGAVGSGDKKIRQETTNTTDVSFTVVKKTAAGAVLDMKIGMVRDVTAGMPVSGYSAKLQLSKGGLAGSTFRVTVRPNGEVTRFEGYEEALAKLAGKSADALKEWKKIVPEESLKAFAQSVFVTFPATAVKKGTSWERPVKVPLGPAGSLEAKYTYTYEGKVGGEDRIAVKAALKYQPPGDNAGSAPFKISGGSVQSEKAEGTIRFNGAAGRLVRFDLTLRLKGTVTIESGRAKASVPVEQDQTVIVRVSSENPFKGSSQ